MYDMAHFGNTLWVKTVDRFVKYDKLGIALLPGYGLTESANLVSGNPEALRNPESVGFIYEGMDYKIVDGELWLKGINMMEGYVGEPEENALAYEDGWFKTGDLVRIDDGCFGLHSRLSCVRKRGSFGVGSFAENDRLEGTWRRGY